MSFITGGSFPAKIVPAQKKQALETNYLNFADGSSDWAQQYLPELYEAEVERYGNRTLGGFLRMVGAEMPMTSDQVLWSEQNRLHIAYNEVKYKSGTKFDINVTTDAGRGANTCAIKVNQTVLISDADTGLVTQKAIVKEVVQPTGTSTTAEIEVVPYGNDGDILTGLQLTGDDKIKIFVYGSEFGKGSDDFLMGSIEPSFSEFHNSPIILRDKYQINGSDAAQIGWIEVATEDGTSGYMWYLKAESETRLRFEDYMEMAMVEGEKVDPGTSGTPYAPNMPGQAAVKLKGTEGLFAAIEDRGNIYQGFNGPVSNAVGSAALGDFDEILKNLDKQGAIEENMLFLNRETALDFDNMLAAVNAAVGQGASYGLFDNEAEMALNFGFTGFRRGSYDFYKTDWKYLNDATTRGMSKAVEGVLIPAGTTTVYDQMLGSNIRRPFLHVRYRASETEDRRYKNWVTGSVGGAFTDGLDAMTVHFLSERCLVTQAANNFVLFKGSAA